MLLQLSTRHFTYPMFVNYMCGMGRFPYFTFYYSFYPVFFLPAYLPPSLMFLPPCPLFFSSSIFTLSNFRTSLPPFRTSFFHSLFILSYFLLPTSYFLLVYLLVSGSLFFLSPSPPHFLFSSSTPLTLIHSLPLSHPSLSRVIRKQ